MCIYCIKHSIRISSISFIFCVFYSSLFVVVFLSNICLWVYWVSSCDEEENVEKRVCFSAQSNIGKIIARGILFSLNRFIDKIQER